MKWLLGILLMFTVVSMDAQVNLDCKSGDLTIDGSTVNLNCFLGGGSCCVSDVSYANGVLTIVEGDDTYTTTIEDTDEQYFDQAEFVDGNLILSIFGDNRPPEVINIQDNIGANNLIPSIGGSLDCDSKILTVTIGNVNSVEFDLSCLAGSDTTHTCEDVPLPDLDISCGNGQLTYTLFGDPDGSQSIDASCVFDIDWPKFSGDAAATIGGLTEGEIYQTSGSSILPDGVLMVKQ